MRSPESVLLASSAESSNTLLVCSIYSDEKPLKRIAGSLDWRLKGFLSRFLVKGWITGEKNEFVYIPIHHQGNMRHLLLVGLGETRESQTRTPSEKSGFLVRFGDTVRKLGFKKIAISSSCFEFIEKEELKKACSNMVEIEYAQ